MSLEDIKRRMLQESKGKFTSSMGEEIAKDWLKSPAKDLNRILSGSLHKSVQIGTHTGLVGPEAAGKSSFMALLLADAQKRGFLPVIIDAEGAWDKDFVTRWGIDPDNVLKISTLWVDDIMPELAKYIDMAQEGDDKNLNLAIAIDSIGALETRKVITDGVDKHDVKADQGRLQKDIKRLLKLIVSLTKFHNCVAFSAGHFYGNPTGYGEPEMIGGGKYYRLACDTIVSLKKKPIYENPTAKTKDKKGKVLGNKITAATLKNRKYPPFQEAIVEIDYLNGVNDIAGLVEVASNIGIIQKSGAWFNCDSLNIKAQGENKFMDELNKVDKKPFLDAIENHLKTTGYSTVNKELELQEEFKEDTVDSSEKDVAVTTKKVKTKSTRGRPKKS